MVLARFGGDPKLGAQERSPEFGNQFLHCVGVVAEALAELAIAAVFVRSPVSLMPISA